MSDDPMAQILDRLTRLDESIQKQFTETRSALMGRMDRLQARIDQLGNEAFVSFAKHENVDRRVTNMREEVRDLDTTVSGLVRQVRALRDRIDSIEGP